MSIEKNKSISLRLTENEYNRLKKLSDENGYSVSNFVRKKIFDKKIINKNVIETFLYNANRIGNNLNQIARYCNTNKSVDKIVLEKLIEIEKEIGKFKNDL